MTEHTVVMDTATFADHLKRCLTLNQMKPYRLAKLSGLNVQHCYKLVNGERQPSDETLLKLAQVQELGLSVDQMRAWRDLSRVSNLMSTLAELPESALIKEFSRRFPDPHVQLSKLQEYALI